ncbi:MAG: hypothetical protein D6795_07185, partial [Deltaproteobacteria bacterium]
NVDRLREIFERIDREVFMNLAEKFREEGKREGLRLAEKFREEGKRQGLLEGKREGLLEGKREGLLGLLRWIAPELARQFEPRLKACQTLEQLEGIEGEIRTALTGTKRR